jgi:hypothetical protein
MQNVKNSNLVLDLKRDVFYRAKIFIDDMGHFAPFGSESINGKIKPIVIYDDTKNNIEVTKWVDLLLTNFSLKLKNKEIEAGAIAYDVFLNSKDIDGKTLKRNALCLQLSLNGIHWDEEYYPYKIINKECVWG